MSVSGTLRDVLAQYDFTVKSVRVENDKEKKAVWWLQTSEGLFVLKKSPNPPARVRFIVAAIEHLQKGGVNIPPLVRTRSGTLWAEAGGACYLVTEAVRGRTPSYSAPEELDAMTGALAAFHRASRGFSPPHGAEAPSHLGTWERTFSERLDSLQSFLVMADGRRDDFSLIARRETPRFIEQARRAIELLRKPSYESSVLRVAQQGNLCHQDFAAGNLSLTAAGIHVFDLDSVTVDLEARDLRKLLNKVVKKLGGWNAGIPRSILRSYHLRNPLSRDDYEVLKADLMFPHLFCGIMSKYYEDREREWSEHKFLKKLGDTIRLETGKEPVLAQFDDVVSSLGPGSGVR